MVCRHVCMRLFQAITAAWLLLVLAPTLPAASVGDPEIRTDDLYFPGELALSTPARCLTHAYSIPRGSVGSATDHDKLIKVFLWRCEKFSHIVSPAVYNLPGRTPDPTADDPLMTDYDSMRCLFSYAWGLCGTNHGQMRPFADEAGWQQRRRGLNGDTGHEIGFGGKWYYVNTDQYTLHFLTNSASADFASVNQILDTNHRYAEWNPDLGGGYFMPQANTHGSYADFAGVTGTVPNRSLQWRSYYQYVWQGPSSSSNIMYGEGFYAAPVVYRLKRGETFTRWLKPDGAVTDLGLPGRAWWGYNYGGSPSVAWSFVQNAPARDEVPGGVEESAAKGGAEYGNGCYDWQPSLANSEYLDGLAFQTGTFTTGGSPVLQCTAAGSLAFEFYSPYAIAARAFTNNPAGKLDPAYNSDLGAVLTTTASGSITVDLSTDGGASWTSLGSLTPSLDFTNAVKGRNSYLLKLNFATGAGLNTLRLRTLTMVAQAVYPNLKNGSTTVTYKAGNLGAYDFSPNLFTAATAGSTTGASQLVADSGVTGVFYGAANPGYAYTQSVDGPISLTYKLTLPANIAAAGGTFKQIFAAEDSQVRVPPNPGSYGKIEISASPAGPWTQIANYSIPTDNDLSHFWTYGRSADGGNVGGTTCYVRLSAYNAASTFQGIRFVRLYGTYNLPAPAVPIDVTYFWNNGSNQTHTHTVAAGTADDSWSIATGTVAQQQKVVFSVPTGGVLPPTITTQPASQTVTAPASATFTVVAAGSGLTYQWRKNGVAIGGATSASYTTPATVTGDSGAIYTVVITNAGGSVTSTPATLTVVAAGSPVITSQPANVTVIEPATATFSVVATGATSYQWKRNGVVLAGATSASYTTAATSVAADNGAQFTVNVTNASGTVTSNPATLTVTAPTTTTTVTLQEGVASYTGTTDTYLDAFDPASSFGNSDRVEVRNWNSGTVENNIGLLRFDLSAVPSTATVTAATLDVWVTRANNVSTADQLVLDKVTSGWTENSTYSGGVPTTTPSGVTPPTVTIPDASPVSPELQYSISGMHSLVQGWVTAPGSNFGLMLTCASNINFRFASSEYANVALRPRLTVTYTTSGGGGSAPVITTQPSSQTVTAPATATFSVVATGATSYQWQKNGVNIAGATSASYTTPATTTADSGSVFRVLVTNASGTTTSNNATLTVNPGGAVPVITTQPSSQTVTAPATATFSVVATGATSYQWQKNGVNIGGATSASYTTPATTTADSGSVFRVLVTNASGTTTSNNATLTVNPGGGGNPVTTSTGSLSFGAPTGSTTKVTTTLILTNTSGGPITVTPAVGSTWLTAGGALTIPAGGTATLTVTADPSGLDGAYTGTLTLTNSTGASQTLPVSFVVGTQTGLKKRSCAIGDTFNPDVALWVALLAGALALVLIGRNRGE